MGCSEKAISLSGICEEIEIFFGVKLVSSYQCRQNYVRNRMLIEILGIQ